MKHFLNWFFKRQITSSKIKKICWQIIVAVLMQPLQYDLPCPAAKTLVLRMQPRHQATWQHHMANSHVATHMATEHDNNQSAITVRSATTGSKTPYNYANTTKHALQNTIKEPITHQNERPAPASHTGCPSSLAAATLHRKTYGFVLRLPPQHNPHPTSMQPLQCVLQHHVANPHVSTHMATDHGNNLQPAHCDLQPAIQTSA